MKKILILGIISITLAVFGTGIVLQIKNNRNPKPFNSGDDTNGNTFSRNLSQGKCQGTGTVAFIHLPMELSDMSTVLPYGTMVGAHVIPTSHGYFGPADYKSARDAYPVYAIADGFIVNISHRGQAVGDNQDPNHVTDEYQMWFEHSCTFYTYYDLLTSLSSDLLQAIGGPLKGFENKTVRIPVKAGQLVGRIGGQTVDFGVWNFEKTPDYFVNPKSYEDDRPYLDDMFKYFAEPIKSQLLAKSARVVDPRSGKVNYDIKGKLVGGWFREGSGGFNGPPGVQQTANRRYWDGHLAIAYDYIDPASIKFSIGNFKGSATQFTVKGNAPDPATVGVETGLIKYELVFGGYVNGDTGKPWMIDSQIAKPQFKENGPVHGVALLQMIAEDKLKVEVFPGKTASEVGGFTDKAVIYER